MLRKTLLAVFLLARSGVGRAGTGSGGSGSGGSGVFESDDPRAPTELAGGNTNGAVHLGLVGDVAVGALGSRLTTMSPAD